MIILLSCTSASVRYGRVIMEDFRKISIGSGCNYLATDFSGSDVFLILPSRCGLRLWRQTAKAWMICARILRQIANTKIDRSRWAFSLVAFWRVKANGVSSFLFSNWIVGYYNLLSFRPSLLYFISFMRVNFVFFSVRTIVIVWICRWISFRKIRSFDQLTRFESNLRTL